MSHEGLSPDDAVKYFIDDLTQASTSADRRDALKNLPTLTKVASPKALETSVIPVLEGLVARESEDELLHTLALEIASVALRIGEDNPKLPQVLKILEALLGHDETAVREQAVETFSYIVNTVISKSRRDEFVNSTHCLGVLERTMKSESFVARGSGALLYAKLYAHFDTAKTSSVTELFVGLAKDESPTTKRVAASSLANISAIVSGQELLTVFHPPAMTFLNDTFNEQLRVSAVTALGNMCRKIPPSRLTQYIMNPLQRSVDDLSWRVRRALVDALPELGKCCLEASHIEVLTSWFETLIVDPQNDVAASAIDALGQCAHVIPVEACQGRLLRVLIQIVTDQTNSAAEIPTVPPPEENNLVQHIAGILGPICIRLADTPSNITHIIPLAELLLQNPCREVRYNTVDQLSDFTVGVKDPASVKQTFLLLVRAALGDPQWRVRCRLIDQLPVLVAARALGSPLEWEPFFYTTLLDSAHAVRNATIEIIPALAKHLGQDWVIDSLLKNILTLHKKSTAVSGDCGSTPHFLMDKNMLEGGSSSRSIRSYTTRKTLINALRKIALVLPVEQITSRIVSKFVDGLKDPIPNIKFLCMFILVELAEGNKVPRSLIAELPSKIRESGSSDSDPDVQRFAKQATSRLKELSAGGRD